MTAVPSDGLGYITILTSNSHDDRELDERTEPPASGLKQILSEMYVTTNGRRDETVLNDPLRLIKAFPIPRKTLMGAKSREIL